MNNRYKYPRTPHLSWSPGFTDDDIIDNENKFLNKIVVVTEKMDGENSTLYSDYYHARSIDSKHHESRAWIKSFQATISKDIPKGWRFCGEYLFAKHSIKYENLKSYFYLFSIWNENNECLSWNETVEIAEILEIPIPKVLYLGEYNEKILKRIKLDFNKQEGYVVRNVNSFKYEEFSKNISKYVRSNHVQTDEHWMKKQVEQNVLEDKKNACQLSDTCRSGGLLKSLD